MLTIANCPICNSTTQSPFMSCVDNTVSRETFNIVQCNACRLKFTNPIPNEDELSEYYKSEEYISHSNSKKGFINSVYQMVRKYTLLKKLKLISKHFKAGNILDIGCGTGEFLNTMKLAKWHTTGIEPDHNARAMAVKMFGLEVKETQELKNFHDESFEVITMWHVLEHVPNLNQRIEDLKRLIKTKGILIIAVPNCSSWDASHYKEHWAAYDVPRHLYHFTPKDIELVFKNHGLKTTQVLPMVFDSFYVSMLSEKIKTGKANVVKALLNGLRSNLIGAKTGMTYSSQIYIIRK